jgi:hypothetical protein
MCVITRKEELLYISIHKSNVHTYAHTLMEIYICTENA